MTKPAEFQLKVRTWSPRRMTTRQGLELEALMSAIPFFEGLPLAVRNEFLERAISRSYGRGEQLRGINTSGWMVHVILDGCVRERITLAESPQASTVRFFGKGSIIGASDIFLEEPQPSVVECLQRTWTLSYPIDRMRVLADTDIALMRKLAQTIALQLRTHERIYAPSRKSAAQRVASLLLELFEIGGTMDKFAPVVGGSGLITTPAIEGPTQGDIADALMLSMASVENTLRALRRMRIVTTEHREFVLTDMHKLKHVATGTLTVETAYKTKPKAAAP